MCHSVPLNINVQQYKHCLVTNSRVVPQIAEQKHVLMEWQNVAACTRASAGLTGG